MNLRGGVTGEEYGGGLTVDEGEEDGVEDGDSLFTL